MKRLRELRLEKGLRQKDVAEKLGISPQSLGYYENGINKPDPDMLIKLADFYEVSVDYILEHEDKVIVSYSPKAALTNDNIMLTAEEIDLLVNFRGLSENEQKFTLGAVRQLNGNVVSPEEYKQAKKKKRIKKL